MDSLVRGFLLFFAATLPLYYDLAVPEVSGDVRWMATFVFAGLTSLLLAVKYLLAKEPGRLTLKLPLQIWFAIGLALWAMVSLLDALNWMRGIILIKALYAQILLMLAVYAVATPAFIRRLLWALVLPLILTSFVGIVQFHGWNSASFDGALDASWIFWPLKPLFWILDQGALWLGDMMGWGNRGFRLVDLLVNYFMQSAVPGSTFANKNLAGSWTAMMLPIALYLLLTAKRTWAQGFASVLLAMGSLFLVYSRARASWLAFMAAMLLMGVLVVVVPAWRAAVLRHLDKSHGWWLMLPVVVLMAWGGDVSPVPGAYAVDRKPSQQVAALVSSSWSEIGGRLAYNLNSLAITKDYWFNGVGLGGFYVIYPPYSHAIVPTPPNSYSVMARPQRTHTDLMQAFDEMGVPGGIFYAGFFIVAIAMALRLAGNRAGALGGKLIGAGFATALLALTLFLEYQDMLAIPSPYNILFDGVLGVMILALLACAVRDARAVQTDTTPADDIQLMGFMAGISLLTICINALMDFPMQLPTAPAAAALVIGAILAVYMRYRPHARVGFGTGRTLTLPARRALWATLLVLLGVFHTWSIVDAVKFRQGNILLKQAMIRIFSGVNDDATMDLILKAYNAYPLDPRIHEHLGVVFANYAGNIPLEYRIDRLEWVLAGDPWGANHLINLIGQNLQLAEHMQLLGKQEEAKRVLVHTEALYTRLQQAADFSHLTWGAGGLLRMLEGKNEEAVALFHRALAIDPTYVPALNGLKAAQAKLDVSPLVVKDALTGGAGVRP